MWDYKNPKRILLKLSWETLKGKSDTGYDFDFMNQLAKKIVSLSESGKEIVIVLWAGNIFRWKIGADLGLDRSTGDYMGMLATIMNSLALGNVLEQNGKEVRVMTAIELPRIAETFIRKRAFKHLQNWRIVIVAAGTGNPYFTTDSAAVLRALELNCDLMIKWTKVDWVYDKDPMKYNDAKRFEELTLQHANELGVNVMDHSSIAMAMDNNLPLFVCKIEDIDKIGQEEIVGTYVI